MTRFLTILTSLTLIASLHASAQCVEGNCYEGVGNFRFENGDSFNGQWRKGLPEGYGVYQFANGDVYKGNMLSGKMEGRGTYTFANGDKYVGGWKAGKMEGRGHFHWDLPGDLMSNAKYEGNFKAGQPLNFQVKETGMPADPPKMK